jgi:hypothetical protein
LFYDEENIDKAWKKLKALYLAEKLPGVLNISKANFPDASGGFAIAAYCGPYNDAEHCLEIGSHLVKLLEHKRQKCNIVNNWPYKKYIYYKPLKEKVGQTRASFKYRVPYK